MKVGIPRETFAGEFRVAVVPAQVPSLTKAGLDVVVEEGAGTAAGFTDEAYRAQGATVAPRSTVLQSEIILQVRSAPGDPAAPDISAPRPLMPSAPAPAAAPRPIRGGVRPSNHASGTACDGVSHPALPYEHPCPIRSFSRTVTGAPRRAQIVRRIHAVHRALDMGHVHRIADEIASGRAEEPPLIEP